MSPAVAKASQEIPHDISTLTQVELKPPSSKKRSTRKEVNYKETSGDSTSSVEYPVEGRHTDDESEDKVSDSGNRTPIFVQQDILPVYNSPSAAFQVPGGTSSFYTRIPKNKKTAKHSKRSESLSR